MEKNVFFTRLTELSQTKNLSINQIEKELNYPRNSLHNYKGQRVPSSIRLMELAAYFNVSPEYLMGVNALAKKECTHSVFNNLDNGQKLEIYYLSKRWLDKERREKLQNKIKHYK